MKKWAIITVLVVLSIFFARAYWVTVSESGEGDAVESPDQRFVAGLQTHYTTGFFGGRHNYYEFTVKTSNHRRIQHIVMDEPPQGMMTGLRDRGWVQWAADSSSVTYSFKGTKLILSVVP